jgi:hypothetical protein
MNSTMTLIETRMVVEPQGDQVIPVQGDHVVFRKSVTSLVEQYHQKRGA